MDRAVADCIEHDILKGFLLKHREEVREMILSEYDEELHIRSEKEISFEEGTANGLIRGKIECILSLLGELGDISRELEERIRSEQDETRLDILLKYAARAESIEAFIKQVE